MLDEPIVGRPIQEGSDHFPRGGWSDSDGLLKKCICGYPKFPSGMNKTRPGEEGVSPVVLAILQSESRESCPEYLWITDPDTLRCRLLCVPEMPLTARCEFLR